MVREVHLRGGWAMGEIGSEPNDRQVVRPMRGQIASSPGYNRSPPTGGHQTPNLLRPQLSFWYEAERVLHGIFFVLIPFIV